MSERLAILVWAAEPGTPQLCATPFHFAATAAAMDAEVEMYFTARSVQLLAKGVAETIYPGGHPGSEPALAHFVQQAAQFGWQLFELHDQPEQRLVTLQRLLPRQWRT